MWDNLGTTNAERLAASFQKEKKVFIAFYSSLKNKEKIYENKIHNTQKTVIGASLRYFVRVPMGGGQML